MFTESVREMFARNFKLTDENNLVVEFTHSIGTVEHYSAVWWEGENKFETTLELKLGDIEVENFSPKS